jgi:hypothetical protein
MNPAQSIRRLTAVSLLALAPFAVGCADIGQSEDNITNVNHTDVERQSIGNCWLYAQASWVESLHLTATGEHFDTSQSYWTYWHWFDELKGGYSDEISTGGNQWTSNAIIQKRGLMRELDFVPEDSVGEMSDRQKNALDTLNEELKTGRLSTREARRDWSLIRDVMDDAWGLSPEVVAQLDQVFGEDGSGSIADGASVDDTAIVDPNGFEVSYTRRVGDSAEWVETNILQAIEEWREADYPGSGWWSNDGASPAERRAFLKRVQIALHDGQPVVSTWNVDFNAMENDADNPLIGSFNMTTLGEAGGAGRQGGHMTVLHDYEAITEEYGLLKAGETLDPDNAEDAAKLDALLLDSTEIVFMRIKNSWGSLRPDRGFAPGMPGYHDLYLDYMNGPIAWCPSVEDEKTEENCTGTTTPFRTVMLPPGY